ncbi:MAG: protoheme IX farnesyltransferase [Ignavibacteria bacterium]|nr:protoheme IX farnesyltransferase [Ignavibacteria bacterium]MCU7503929.1 protoheme IX farnesyltransferase [Ignavibacteria bacterium]MCU7515850.1 protoheme IX farnesyltransferase [Ignavibacteria bacterium]
MNRLNNKEGIIPILLELGKVRITLFVAVSTSVGFILAAGKLSWQAFFVTLGVFLLACGSSALNHFQERNTDAMMSRTKQRPIPSGAVSPFEALIVVISFSLSGLVVLYFSGSLKVALLGMLALLWYNAFYTPLKKLTALAVVPGALIGSIPPVIGYVAAGGKMTNPEILAVALFFFIWQVPHFWLLLMIYAKDYQRAGFPVLTDLFSTKQLTRITFMWIVALAVSCLLIALFGVVKNPVINMLLVLAGAWLVWDSRKLIMHSFEKMTYRFAFREINIYVLLVVILLSINKLFNF